MVNYNSFAKTFSNSRKNMKWDEIEYFLDFLKWKKDLKILDVWCWSGRLLWELISNKLDIKIYLWIDLSKWLLNEAKKEYTSYNFLELNMLDLNKINKKYDVIFLIATFHHLKNMKERLKVLKNISTLLEKNWKIYMTNWALNSNLNFKKYKDSRIIWSKNDFWNYNYNIKIWKFTRFYHSFDLEELKYLFNKIWFSILENRLYKNDKNFISIFEKK